MADREGVHFKTYRAVSTDEIPGKTARMYMRLTEHAAVLAYFLCRFLLFFSPGFFPVVVKAGEGHGRDAGYQYEDDEQSFHTLNLE